MEKFDVLMLCVAVAGAALCAVIENWLAMMWAINTAIWVIVASRRR